MSTAVQTRVVTVEEGRELCVEVAGDDSAQTLLLCAGTPNSRHLDPTWIDVARERGVRLVGYDRPGYGRSTPRPGRSVADGAADIRAIGRALRAERLAVCGFSGGGPYALACAALLPELVCAAAIIGSKAPWDAPGLDYLAGMGDANVKGIEHFFEDPEDDRRQLEAMWQRVRQITPRGLLDAWETLLSPADREVLSGEFVQTIAQSIRDGLAPGPEGWWDDGVAELAPWAFELSSIRVPVKIWHGKQDRFVPFQHGEWLSKHVPGAEAALSDSDGHWTVFAEVVEVTDWLLGHC